MKQCPANPDGGPGFLGLVSQRGGQTTADGMEAATRLWWVRHAPVAHGGRIYGQMDLPATALMPRSG